MMQQDDNRIDYDIEQSMHASDPYSGAQPGNTNEPVASSAYDFRSTATDGEQYENESLVSRIVEFIMSFFGRIFGRFSR